MWKFTPWRKKESTAMRSTTIITMIKVMAVGADMTIMTMDTSAAAGTIMRKVTSAVVGIITSMTTNAAADTIMTMGNRMGRSGS